jgi:hypothetical protein
MGRSYKDLVAWQKSMDLAGVSFETGRVIELAAGSWRLAAGFNADY